MAKELPINKASWNQAVKSNDLTHNTIHDLPKKELHSASKIQIEQYLLLRVLWKAEDAIEFTAKDWLDTKRRKNTLSSTIHGRSIGPWLRSGA